MPTKFDDTKQLRCSFCGKTQDQVKRLIAGPNVYICDECIELCSEIIEEELEGAYEEDEATDIPKPKEIKAHLDEYVIGQDDAKKALAVAVLDSVIHELYKKPWFAEYYNPDKLSNMIEFILNQWCYIVIQYNLNGKFNIEKSK